MQFDLPALERLDGTARVLRAHALAIFAAALRAVDPAAAVRRHLHRAGDTLWAGEHRYDLRRYDRVLLVGAGKAGAPMAAAVEEVLGDRLTDGVVVVKRGYGGPTRVVALVEAGHPVPDEAGVQGGERIAQLLSEASERDLVIAVISGGGSALLTWPAPGITLADLQALTNALLRSGATINEINTVRKHLDRAKGGGLARLAQPAEVLTLVLSDVVGDPLDAIASGPTVPDPTTFADAAAILDRFGLWPQTPPAIAAWLRAGLAGQVAETPKPGDPLFARARVVVVGSNALAAEAALAEAAARGFEALLLTTELEGEAREVARALAAIAREEALRGRPLPRPACLIAGGETTVTVRGPGRGGRNQELALSAALKLAGLADVLLLSAATDGTDGPTDAAGAVADGTTLARAEALGMSALAFLDANDSYPFFDQLGDLLRTGPTNTNVNDLVIILAGSPAHWRERGRP